MTYVGMSDKIFMMSRNVWSSARLRASVDDVLRSSMATFLEGAKPPPQDVRLAVSYLAGLLEKESWVCPVLYLCRT